MDIDELRHAADEDENAGHTLQATYIRAAADEIERLTGLLEGRDAFIVSIGKWHEFVDALPNGNRAAGTEGRG